MLPRRFPRTFAAILSAIAWVSLLAIPVYAALPNAPNLQVHSAWAVQNVATTGDLLVFWRISLPSTAWSPYGPTASIGTLVQGSTDYQDRAPAEIGETISAFYLPAGHSFTWNSAASVTLQSNPTLFATNTSDSVPVQFLATSTTTVDSDADQDLVCDLVRSLLTAVESEDSGDAITFTDYVGSTFVTTAGSAVSLAAFGSIAIVLPRCFIVGAISGASAFDPNDPLFKQGLTATVEATAAWARWDTFAAAYGFDNEDVAAALLGIAFAGTMLVLSLVFFNSSAFGATLGALTLFGASLNAPQILTQIVFVIAMILVLMAGAYWIRGLAR